jgi:hypothetical protein
MVRMVHVAMARVVLMMEIRMEMAIIPLLLKMPKIPMTSYITYFVKSKKKLVDANVLNVDMKNFLMM